MRLFVCLFLFITMSLPAWAQEYLDQPICFKLMNNAPYTVYGDVSTAADVYTGDDVQTDEKINHTATFRIQENGTFDICTTGPLYPGDKVRLTLRTLVPVFECLTYIYPGARINIRGHHYEDERRTETWAECL